MNEKWVKVKEVMKSKLFVIIVSVVVVLFIVVFPHTKTTTVHGELSGIFVTQKERYLLHTRVSFESEFVCAATTTVKSQTIKYGLNGDIKSTNTTNCDGTYFNIDYNTNGTMKAVESISFAAGNISTSKQIYNKLGSLESQTTDVAGTLTETTNVYYETNGIQSSTVVTSVFGLKTSETVASFDEESVMTEQTTKTWKNTVLETDLKTEFEDGIVTDITYSDFENGLEAEITCSITGCILDNLDADKYSVQYSISTLDYDMLVDGETSSVKVTFTPINMFNVATVLSEIEGKAQVILDAQ